MNDDSGMREAFETWWEDNIYTYVKINNINLHQVDGLKSMLWGAFLSGALYNVKTAQDFLGRRKHGV
jgi:hypothetical protein